MPKLRILSVDDADYIVQNLIKKNLSSLWEIELAQSYKEGLTKLRREHFDVLLLDKDLGPASPTGIDLITDFRSEFPDLVIILITHDDNHNGISKALENGATDYIVKSESLYTDLILRIPEAVDRKKRRLAVDLWTYQSRLVDPVFLLGNSKAVNELKVSLKGIDDFSNPIVLSGESGSGKRTLARHLWSLKNDPCRPFVSLSLMSIQKPKLELELFGNEKGKKGALLLASKGDLLISDIHYMPPSLKDKVLHALRYGFVRPLGSDRAVSIQTRLFVSSHKNALSNKKFKRFKQLWLPPLRERIEDVEDIALAYLKQNRLKDYFLSDKAIAFLKNQTWPGNFTQLLSTLDLALNELKNENREKIDTSDLIRSDRERSLKSNKYEALMPQNKGEITAKCYSNFLTKAEKSFLIQALSSFEWNMKATAKALGLARSTLYKKLEQLNIALE